MGHFNSSCAISKAPIYQGDKVARFLLMPNSYLLSCIRTKGLIVSNNGAQGAFTLASFPIIGTYDDYGGLEDIEMDQSVALLRSFFNAPIYTIMSAVERGRWVDSDANERDLLPDQKYIHNINALIKMCYMDVRYDIYEHMLNMYDNDNSGWFSYTKNQIAEDIENYFKEKEDRTYSPIYPATLYVDRYATFNFIEKIGVTKNHLHLIQDGYKFVAISNRLGRLYMPSISAGQDPGADSDFHKQMADKVSQVMQSYNHYIEEIDESYNE